MLIASHGRNIREGTICVKGNEVRVNVRVKAMTGGVRVSSPFECTMRSRS